MIIYDENYEVERLIYMLNMGLTSRTCQENRLCIAQQMVAQMLELDEEYETAFEAWKRKMEYIGRQRFPERSK